MTVTLISCVFTLCRSLEESPRRHKSVWCRGWDLGHSNLLNIASLAPDCLFARSKATDCWIGKERRQSKTLSYICCLNDQIDLQVSVYHLVYQGDLSYTDTVYHSYRPWDFLILSYIVSNCLTCYFWLPNGIIYPEDRGGRCHCEVELFPRVG